MVGLAGLGWWMFLLAFCSCTPAVLGITEFEALQVVKGFADKFLAPGNSDVVKTINSTLFAEDVLGSIDLSTNFDSRELSTEYLFGLFVNNDLDQSDPSPFGVPMSYNVTHIVVEHAYIASSIIFQFYYRALDQSFPVQIDSYILINDQKQIQQYDAIFRRWSWATDVIVPLLIPHMALKIRSASTNSTFILQQYLAQKICNASATYCTGQNQQYDSFQSCMDWVMTRPIGQWYRMGEDNLVCRHLHVAMVPLRPSVHCPHIGPTGGDMCIDRDYRDVVLASHFPLGWIAPKITTPENTIELKDIEATNGVDLPPELEIAMSLADLHSWDPTLYATALLCYFLIYYVSAKLIWFLYIRSSSVFHTLTLEYQKNVVMYTLNIIYTSLALAFQLNAAPAFRGDHTLWEVKALRTGGVLISALYVFELVYRLRMRTPMIIHHFLTIFAISWTVTVFEYTSSMSYMVSAIIWLFQATTEQPTFLGLLGYRLNWNAEWISRLLKFAAIQSFITKSASAIVLMAYWGIHQNYDYRAIDTAWTVILFLVGVSLLLTQIWGSYVTYSIGRRIERQSTSNLQEDSGGSALLCYQPLRKRSDSGFTDCMTDDAYSSVRGKTPTRTSLPPPIPRFSERGQSNSIIGLFDAPRSVGLSVEKQ